MRKLITESTNTMAHIEIQELKQMIAELLKSQQENAIRFKETDERFKETDRVLSERFKETDTKFKETAERFRETDTKFKETAERFKETDRVLSEKFNATDKRVKQAFELFESQWGKLMEALVEGDLVNLLRTHGIDVHKTSMRVKGEHKGHNYEFDIIAHDSDELVIIEVKTTLRVKHVKGFVKQLQQVKTWMPEYKDKKIYGAVAFLKSEEEAEAYAQKQKLFAIKAVGDSAYILNPKGFQPKAF